jgi:hypothetical protein
MPFSSQSFIGIVFKSLQVLGTAVVVRVAVPRVVVGLGEVAGPVGITVCVAGPVGFPETVGILGGVVFPVGRNGAGVAVGFLVVTPVGGEDAVEIGMGFGQGMVVTNLRTAKEQEELSVD